MNRSRILADSTYIWDRGHYHDALMNLLREMPIAVSAPTPVAGGFIAGQTRSLLVLLHKLGLRGKYESR